METETEERSVVLLKRRPRSDDTVEEGSIDDYSSSYKSFSLSLLEEEDEEPSDSIMARKKHGIEREKIEEEEIEEDEDEEGSNYDSDYDEQEDKAEAELQEEEDFEVMMEKWAAYLFDRRDKYPEGYNHVMYLSNVALQYYNKKSSTGFVVLALKKMYFRMIRASAYELTFTATYPGVTNEETFKASLLVDPYHIAIKVVSCDIIKPDSMLVCTPTHTHNYSLGKKEPSDHSGFNEQSDPLELISTLMTLSDDKLLGKIKNYSCPDEDQDLLLKKVCKYFSSVVQSKGFKCSYFPGHIPGITDFKPREKLIYNMNSYPQGYDHLCIMTNLALSYYFKDKGTKHGYVCATVENANMWKESSCSYVYYVTFRVLKEDLIHITVKDPKMFEYFEAKVRDKQRDIVVLFCRKLDA
ncbi:hypothetical protein OROHE_005118 [Orobanche hederae]